MMKNRAGKHRCTACRLSDELGVWIMSRSTRSGRWRITGDLMKLFNNWHFISYTSGIAIPGKLLFTIWYKRAFRRRYMRVVFPHLLGLASVPVNGNEQRLSKCFGTDTHARMLFMWYRVDGYVQRISVRQQIVINWRRLAIVYFFHSWLYRPVINSKILFYYQFW